MLLGAIVPHRRWVEAEHLHHPPSKHNPHTVRAAVVNGQTLGDKRDGVAKRCFGDPLGSAAALLNNRGAITDTFTY